MKKYLVNLARLITVLFIFAAATSHADYELPESLLGYKMILASKLRTDDGGRYIGFVQDGYLNPPFVLIGTVRYDMHIAKIAGRVEDTKLIGKIYLPAALSVESINELRINGYTILWKNIE